MTYSWASLDALLATFEGAAYIAHVDVFRRNVAAFTDAFRRRYPRTQLGYSYKTNYLPRLCVEAQRLGLYAEVVSGMEFEMALALGVPHERIIFNGPVKTPFELERALAGGAVVNLDSLSEAQVLARIAPTLDRVVRVGLRCNLGIKWKGRCSRFGLDASNGDLQAAARLLRGLPNVVLAGLHCHSSFDRSAQSYRQRAEMLVAYAGELFRDGRPQFLDVGGGFCGPMPPELRSQFALPPPTLEEYADAITDVLHREYGREEGPELILEPGVGLVADVFDYACRVEHVKVLPDRDVAITAGACQHIKIVPNEINPPMRVFHRPDALGGEAPAQVDFAGFTCLEHDILYRDYQGRVRAGDIAVFANTGAYSLVTSPAFIRTTPPVVALDSDGRWQVLSAKLTVAELLSRFTW